MDGVSGNTQLCLFLNDNGRHQMLEISPWFSSAPLVSHAGDSGTVVYGVNGEICNRCLVSLVEEGLICTTCLEGCVSGKEETDINFNFGGARINDRYHGIIKESKAKL